MEAGRPASTFASYPSETVDERARSETARLRQGAFILKLGHWPSAGQKRVRVHVVGNGWAKPATKVVTFKVRKRSSR